MMQPRDLSLGTLELVEVYDYFDEPILWSCINERDQRFVVLLAASDGNRKVWLYSPVSPSRLSALREGKLSTHDVFRAAEGGALFSATWLRGDRSWQCDWVDASAVPDEFLPLPGVLLDLEPEEAEEDRIPNVKRRSEQLRRDVLALRIKLPERQDHEAPAAIVGPLITNLQKTINAIGQSIFSRPTDRAPIPAKVLGKVQLDVASTFAASFGIEFHANSPADLLGDSPVTGVVDQLLHLVEATKDADELRAKLSAFGGRLPSRYRDFLSVLKTANAVDLAWGSPKPGAGGRASLTNASILKGLLVLGTLDPREPHQYTVVARLIGINIRTRTYELLDESEPFKYSGRIDDAAMDSASQATVNRVYNPHPRDQGSRGIRRGGVQVLVAGARGCQHTGRVKQRSRPAVALPNRAGGNQSVTCRPTSASWRPIYRQKASESGM